MGLRSEESYVRISASWLAARNDGEKDSDDDDDFYSTAYTTPLTTYVDDAAFHKFSPRIVLEKGTYVRTYVRVYQIRVAMLLAGGLVSRFQLFVNPLL